jgi:hypothetical protein
MVIIAREIAVTAAQRSPPSARGDRRQLDGKLTTVLQIAA